MMMSAITISKPCAIKVDNATYSAPLPKAKTNIADKASLISIAIMFKIKIRVVFPFAFSNPMNTLFTAISAVEIICMLKYPSPA